MSLRSFLYATDAMMEDDGVRFAMRIGDDPVNPEPTPQQTKARNDDAMAQFKAMMGGVQTKGRRR